MASSKNDFLCTLLITPFAYLSLIAYQNGAFAFHQMGGSYVVCYTAVFSVVTQRSCCVAD